MTPNFPTFPVYLNLSDSSRLKDRKPRLHKLVLIVPLDSGLQWGSTQGFIRYPMNIPTHTHDTHTHDTHVLMHTRHLLAQHTLTHKHTHNPCTSAIETSLNPYLPLSLQL